ncbi:hypothetical protein M434DRAFT_33891 [Hypoxylon sp. CO27-5]|nr:hypothetical protein M434DRAFT_33891 [Hypoxylon sp. CO27-5]
MIGSTLSTVLCLKRIPRRQQPTTPTWDFSPYRIPSCTSASLLHLAYTHARQRQQPTIEKNDDDNDDNDNDNNNNNNNTTVPIVSTSDLLMKLTYLVANSTNCRRDTIEAIAYTSVNRRSHYVKSRLVILLGGKRKKKFVGGLLTKEETKTGDGVVSEAFRSMSRSIDRIEIATTA